HDHTSQPRLGVPGESEKALIIKEIVSEDSDAQKMPGEGAPPGRDRQNPGHIPGVQDRRENETGAERPKHAAPPITHEEEANQPRYNKKDYVVAIMLLMPVWRNRV